MSDIERADISLSDAQAGRDLTVVKSMKVYMTGRGPEAHRAFIERPDGPWNPRIGREESIEDLRTKLLFGREHPPRPVPITVTGTLFPCALLSSVLIPSDKAKKLHEYIHEQKPRDRWGGIDAAVTGVLAHRKYFKGNVDASVLELFGGLLGYCLWLDDDNPKHGIEPAARSTSVCSGYLWKCVAPLDAVADGKPSLNDVYFIWEHTNFASPAAVAYNLDSLVRKEEYLAERYGRLVMVQKSSWLVPGKPAWSPEEIYRLLLKKSAAGKI